MNNIKKQLGLRIRELRLKKKLKQSELSELLGIEPRSISRIESGFHFPKDENLYKIADALGVSVKDLFTFSHLKSEKILQNEIINLVMKANKKELTEIYRHVEVIMK